MEIVIENTNIFIASFALVDVFHFTPHSTESTPLPTRSPSMCVCTIQRPWLALAPFCPSQLKLSDKSRVRVCVRENGIIVRKWREFVGLRGTEEQRKASSIFIRHSVLFSSICQLRVEDANRGMQTTTLFFSWCPSFSSLSFSFISFLRSTPRPTFTRSSPHLTHLYCQLSTTFPFLSLHSRFLHPTSHFSRHSTT